MLRRRNSCLRFLNGQKIDVQINEVCDLICSAVAALADEPTKLEIQAQEFGRDRGKRRPRRIIRRAKWTHWAAIHIGPRTVQCALLKLVISL
jgi:hypothetical protein